MDIHPSHYFHAVSHNKIVSRLKNTATATASKIKSTSLDSFYAVSESTPVIRIKSKFRSKFYLVSVLDDVVIFVGSEKACNEAIHYLAGDAYAILKRKHLTDGMIDSLKYF